MAALDHFEIEYLVVGGVAVGFHSEPRFTKDLDVLVHVEADSVCRIVDALTEFGAPTHLVNENDFLRDDFVFYFGAPPWRIDILTSIPGIDFQSAYNDRMTVPFGDRMATCISKEWLIKAKLASGRHQDLADVESLRAGSDAEDL